MAAFDDDDGYNVMYPDSSREDEDVIFENTVRLTAAGALASEETSSRSDPGSDVASMVGGYTALLPAAVQWEDAARMLETGGVLARRPSRIPDADCAGEQIFLECPIQKRRKGDDKWMTSGGRKGAIDCWAPGSDVGVLKRYGRVVRKDLPSLKYVQYTRQVRGDAAVRPPPDLHTKAVWVVQPLDNPAATPPQQAAAAATGACREFAPSADEHHATVAVKADTKFISFQSSCAGEDGLELGAVVRADLGGVKLQSSQGDFAEWYKRAPGEPPMEEGDVVGFRRGPISSRFLAFPPLIFAHFRSRCFWTGRITRRTNRCEMLGIVSRKAVVEGSAPPEPERHLYDTVAHCGVVPVKLSLSQRGQLACECPAPRLGQLLTPSGLHDGTAILVPATEAVARVGILLDDAAPPETAASADASGSRMVTALVVTPTETTYGSVGRTRQVRRLALSVVWLMATVALAVVVVVSFIPPQSDGVAGGTGAPKAAPEVPLIWGSPTMEILTALCPAEVASCIHPTPHGPSQPVDSCQDGLRDAMRHDNLAGLWEPGIQLELLAVFGCYFGQFPPVDKDSCLQWPPLVPDILILKCGSLLQRCMDSDGCNRELNAAFNSSHPTGGPQMMELIGCYYFAAVGEPTSIANQAPVIPGMSGLQLLPLEPQPLPQPEPEPEPVPPVRGTGPAPAAERSMLI